MTPHDAAVDPHADSTGKTSTRDTSSSSFISPTTRTLTRYQTQRLEQCPIPGMSIGVRILTKQRADYFDVVLFDEVTPLLTLLAQQDEEIARLTNHADVMEQAANQQHGPCIAQIESGLRRIQALMARAERAEANHLDANLRNIQANERADAAEAEIASLRAQLDSK